MESSMLKMLKSQNPDKEYPSNLGKAWDEDEESLLIEELYSNMDIETIARNHNRTMGGINSRRRLIAYNMYLNNSTMESIIKWTKLDEECIKQIIEKKSGNNSVKIKKDKPIKIKKVKDDNVIGEEVINEDNNIVSSRLDSINYDIVGIKKDIMTMKRDMKELKITMNDMFEMMRSFYEIKDACEEL
jgi:hypothetical protein